MKLRLDFVTNSSSSSFVCDVCGLAASGYDGEYDDCTPKCCVNGHCFCDEHLDTGGWDLTRKVKWLQGELKKDSLDHLESEDIEAIWAGDVELVNDIFDDSFDNIINEDEISADLCPLCNLTAISDSTVLRFLAKESGMDLDVLRLKLRRTFRTLKTLEGHLDETKA